MKSIAQQNHYVNSSPDVHPSSGRKLVAYPPYPVCKVLFGRVGDPESWAGCNKPATLVGAVGSVAEGIGYCAEHEDAADPELWRSQFVRVAS